MVTRVPGNTGQGLPGYPEIHDKGYQSTRRYRTRVTRVPGDTGQGLPGYPEKMDRVIRGYLE